jgi:hypothetical protein
VRAKILRFGAMSSLEHGNNESQEVARGLQELRGRRATVTTPRAAPTLLHGDSPCRPLSRSPSTA